ncbi:MAG: M23 family metallopeptidase [Sulfurovaceae bacterium]|nr:M23 family metallopeptidase [Sulfurovaceae bacterium]
MKHRIIISISDIRGTRSYSISKLFRRFIFWIIGFIVFTAVIGAIIVPILTNKIMELATQNEIYQHDLENKIADYEKLGDKFEALQEKITAYEKMSNPPPVIKQETILASKKVLTPEERLASLKNILELKRFVLQHIPNGSPIGRARIVSSFGYRVHPIFRIKKMHLGVDLQANVGTPVYAAANGIVTRVVDRDVGGYGKLIVIRHKYGFGTAYAHLSKAKVDIGDIVKKGQLIALSGNTGTSTGPHLHYEVHYKGNAINPSPFISWSMVNYNKIFKQQKDIPWESLVKRIQS